ncbi:MAG: methionyl-tRNA formyltransferase [Proteobacteria bacterium]|nr:methionyl-tRNA formyltransferase [Pseudomonadota bacterium]
MGRLSLAFFGTPDFAVPVLAGLLEAGHGVVCVYSQPPRPAGRGHRARPASVHRFAEARGLAVRTPTTLKDPKVQRDFAALGLDAAVVAAYGLLLPAEILSAPRLGCLNVHASLLPRWRGAAPIARAILAGDAESGVTIMRMSEDLDSGVIVLQERMPVPSAATAASLEDALAGLGARLIVQALDGLDRGRLEPVPQPADGVTWAAKLTRAEGRLDWHRPAAELERRVRAFAPQPGAWFTHDGERIKVLAAAIAPAEGEGRPGVVLDDRLTVACGEDALRLLELQRAGRAAMSAAAFLRGYEIPAGAALPCPDGG